MKFSPFELPSDFGHYRVKREIAAVGMGMVCEAEDTRLGRHVALKMLRQVFFVTPKASRGQDHVFERRGGVRRGLEQSGEPMHHVEEQLGVPGGVRVIHAHRVS